ncbi:mannose-P-dolichol utilization defect 1 protein, partial [Atractiella rhizophila]
ILTHHLPFIVREPLVKLIGTECYTKLVWNLDLTSTQCLRYSISKVLGLGIVVGGSIVKVPQIWKIVRSRSVRGLSLSFFLLDTVSLLLVVSYNVRNKFPFSTYGENLFLFIQNIIIMTLILHYTKQYSPILFLVLLVPIISFFFSPLLPSAILTSLVALSIPLSLSSKFPQIIQNYRQRSTGQLSAFLIFNSFAGCVARVFTTSTETGDPVLWWGFVCAATLNGILAIQMALYWNRGMKGEVYIPLSNKRRHKD